MAMKMKQIRIKSNKDNLDFVLLNVFEELEEYNPSMKYKLRLELIIEELFLNICNYAYEDEGDILIQCFVEDKTLRTTIIFIDNGIPFNPLEKEEAYLNLNADEREIGGLGLTIVRKYADELEYKYENNQNILTVTKIF